MYYEMFMLEPVLKVIKQYPREIAAIVVVGYVIPETHKRYTTVKFAKLQHDIDLARIQRQTAEFNFKTAEMNAKNRGLE